MKKAIYIIGGAVSSAVIGYFVYGIFKAKKEKEQAEANAIDTGTSESNLGDDQQSSKGAKESKDSLPMSVGSYGYKVSLLQSALKKLGASITVDGKYGEKTHEAISDFGDVWYITCDIGFVCKLTQEEYNDILRKAEKNGWNKKQAKESTESEWLPFSPDEGTFGNIVI